MADFYDVTVTVKSVKGICSLEHFEGEQFKMGSKTPAGMCPSAYYTVYPWVKLFQYGGSFPQGDDPDTMEVACPDAATPVVFEIRRVRGE